MICLLPTSPRKIRNDGEAVTSPPFLNPTTCIESGESMGKSTHERFEEKYLVNQKTGCWEWQASLSNGYGQFYYNKKQGTAHRYSYQYFNGPIPDGLFVMHKCNNSVCCNPEHLELGTASDNMNYREKCGRGRWSGFRLNRPSNKTKWKTTMKSRIKSSVIVNSKTGCWEWQKAKDDKGYGLVTWKCRQWFAHRFSYMAFRGVDPKEKLVRHTCDNPCCVNPDHLILGTPKDNTLDAKERGRLAHGERHHASVLTEKDVLIIRALKDRHPGRSGISYFMSVWFGVTDATISAVTKRQSWSHI